MQNSLLRLGIAVVLAILAGTGNYYWMTTRDKPGEYVGFANDIAADKLLDEGMIKEISVPGNAAELKKTFIPWEERENLFGRRVTKNSPSDSLALAQDFTGTGPQWRVLGPFKLISVGERIRDYGSGGYSEGSGGQTLTIAAKVIEQKDGKEVYSPQIQELLEILYRPSEKSNQIGRIVAIQIYPESSTISSSGNANIGSDDATASGILPLKKDERGLMVPLNDVESIPEVMLRGSEIGFVVKL